MQNLASRLRPVPRIHALTGKTISVLSPRQGDTIRDFYNRERPKFALPTIVVDVEGDGSPILMRDWDRPIAAGDKLALFSSPMGGGGQGGGGSRGVASIIGLIAVVALATVVAGPAGAALAGAIGGSAAAATSAISALIIGAGAYLINHFLGPPRPRRQALEYTTDITSNAARSQQPVPVQYGTVKFFPDVASPSFSDYLGTQQVFHGLYSIGVGSYDILEIGINLQPIWHKDTGPTSAFASILQVEQIEPGAQCHLVPTNVYSSTDVSGQTLPDPYGTLYADGSRSTGPNGETSGPSPIGYFPASPPATLATQFTVDLIWGSGLYYTSPNGNGQRATDCRIWCYYQEIDDAGAPIGAPVLAFNSTFHANQKIPYRLSIPVPLPSPMRVQVLVARLDMEGRTGITDSVSWAGLRSYLQGPNTVPYATRLAVQLVSDKLLSGYSGQQIYVIATRKIPVLVSGSMVLQPSQNPYWAALDVWCNADYGGGQDINRADLAGFAALAAEADTRVDTFNYRFVAQTTVLDAIETCLRPACAVPVYSWDRLSAMRDADPRTFPKAMLTDYDIVRGTLDLAYTLKDAQTSDGVIVQYTDETTWRPAEVKSVADATVLLHPTRVTVPGTTKRKQAVVAARYLAAVNNFRRKVVTLETEATSKLLARGDLVTVQSELPLSWGQAGQIVTYNPSTRALTFAAPLDWAASGAPYVRIAQANGTPWGPVLCARGADDYTAILDATDAARVATQTGIAWTAAIARNATQERASVEFGNGTPLAFQGLVTRITQGGAEGTLKLELVNDAPEVYTIDTTSVPALPVPSPTVLPASPGVISGLSAYVKQDGMSLVLYASWNPDPVAETYTAQVSYDDGANWPFVAYPGGELASFQYGPIPAADSGSIVIRVRGRASTGAVGPWTLYTVTTPALSFQPQDVGYTLKYYDIAPDVLDAQAIADQLEIATVLQAVAAETRAQTIDVQKTFSDYTQTQKVIDLTSTVDTGHKQLSASIIQEAGLRVTADEATATIITALNATVTTNAGVAAAAISTEQTARATADTAIASSVTTLTATVNGNTADILTESVARSTADTSIAATVTTLTTTVNGNTSAISNESATRSSADSTMAANISSLSSTVGSNTAAISSEATTRASADTSLSASITSLAASGGAGTANGNLSWIATSSPAGGVTSRFSLFLTATATGSSTQYAGLSLEALGAGYSQIVFLASNVLFEDSATRFVPFGIASGVIFLQGVTKVSQTISSQVQTFSGHPIMSLDFVNGVIDIWDNT